MNRLILGVAVFVSMIPVPARLLAHHGAAVYDTDTTVSVTGLVTQFQFVNPHVLISISAMGEDGNRTEWTGELTSPNRLARMGTGDVRWHTEILKPGDEITLTGNPARNGAPGLRLTAVKGPDGTMLIGQDR